MDDNRLGGPALGLDERVRRARLALSAAVVETPPPLRRLQQRSRRRRAVAGGALGGLVIVVAASLSGVAQVSSVDTTGWAGRRPGTENASLPTPGATRPTAPSPLAGRSTMASVWTGEEMLIWGGEGGGNFFDDGAAYDPMTDTWRALSPAPLSARNAPAAIWTGSEMILWGGHSEGTAHVDGAAYDPTSDTWRTIADAPMASGGLPTGVWTGSEMIVLAGFNSTQLAAYDPTANAWRTLAAAPGQPLGPDPSAVWTGQELVTFASHGAGSQGGIFAYRPDEDRWRALPTPGVDAGVADAASPGPPPSDRRPQLAWTGARLLAITQTAGARVAASDGGSGSWVGLAPWPADLPPLEMAEWTGSHVLLWGGDRAVLVDPTTGTARSTPTGAGAGRLYPALVWADGVLVVWGGWEQHADGLVLRPVQPEPTEPASTVALPPAVAPPPDRVPVAGPEGTTRGTINRNGPPAEVDGNVLPLLPVEDEDGNLVGYFGCSFLERELVEADDFDPANACPFPPGTIGPG